MADAETESLRAQIEAMKGDPGRLLITQALKDELPKYPIAIWGLPETGGTFLGVSTIRVIVFWCLYWGPLILGKYHIGETSG